MKAEQDLKDKEFLEKQQKEAYTSMKQRRSLLLDQNKNPN